MSQHIDVPGMGIVEFPDGMSDAEMALAIKRNTPVASSWSDAPNAIGTGGNKGLLRLAGLPVDTAANVIDLGKAALGAPYTAITGKPAPDWLQIGDRSNVPLSGDWLIKQAQKTDAGQLFTEPQNPRYRDGYLEAFGQALSGILNPTTRAQAVNQAVLNTAGTLGGKAVGELTGVPALAVTAGLLPGAAQNIATATAKRLVRGSEDNVPAIQQRIQDLKNAGVDNPTLGLATGKPSLGGLENLLQNTPGAVGIMRNARDAAVAGMENKAAGAANAAATDRGAFSAGSAVQGGIRSFKDDFKARQNQLYGGLDEHIPPLTPTPVGRTLDALGSLNQDITGAPEVSKFFKNSKMVALADALKKDTAGAPETVMVYSQPARGGGGLMNEPIEQPPSLVRVPAGPPRNELPWEAVKKTRTLVGNEIADNSLLSDVPRSKWNALYAALSNDMQNAATHAGPAAEGAFNRATNYTRAGLDRLDRLAPFADKAAPEQAFTSLENTLKENGSIFQAVKKSLPEGARGQVAGTVIDRLGKATPGQQDETGGRWSPDRFLTSWNRMTPSAQKELLSGFKNSDQVRADVEAVAKAAAMMRDSSKLWANPSGTGANMAARGTIGTIAAGGAGSLLGLVNPIVPLGAAGAVFGANRLAKALTDPSVRDAMASRTNLDPQLVQALLASMAASGQLNKQDKP